MFTFITPKAVARKSVENVYADKSKFFTVTTDLAMRYFDLKNHPQSWKPSSIQGWQLCLTVYL